MESLQSLCVDRIIHIMKKNRIKIKYDESMKKTTVLINRNIWGLPIPVKYQQIIYEKARKDKPTRSELIEAGVSEDLALDICLLQEKSNSFDTKFVHTES